jgi:hypothetical protein
MLGPIWAWGSDKEMLFSLVMIIAHHLVVDKITQIHGTPGNTAVRVTAEEQKTYTKLTRFAQFMYAYYQICAVVSHMQPGSHSNDLGFNTIAAIQSSTFLFTLNRKSLSSFFFFCLLFLSFFLSSLTPLLFLSVSGLISEHTHGFIYSMTLAVSFYVMFIQCGGMMFVLKTAVVYIFRVVFKVNKYAIWIALFLVTVGSPMLFSAYPSLLSLLPLSFTLSGSN